ncbi:MAG TPA: universal stress protein [Bacteroidetes bacterium]|nr:universal stress protein [Bacteroidota bacterium]
MTKIAIDSVGFCALYSKQGDWAFDLAFRIAETRGIQLNVFHFLSDPYDPEDKVPDNLSKEEWEAMTIESERNLRMYYDVRLRDYLKVGFRLCEDKEWTELHRCLVKREFDVLILGVPSENATFAGKPIREFADSFISPVVLVGPDDPDTLYLNPQAELISDQLSLSDEARRKLQAAHA